MNIFYSKEDKPSIPIALVQLYSLIFLPIPIANGIEVSHPELIFGTLLIISRILAELFIARFVKIKLKRRDSKEKLGKPTSGTPIDRP